MTVVTHYGTAHHYQLSLL